MNFLCLFESSIQGKQNCWNFLYIYLKALIVLFNQNESSYRTAYNLATDKTLIFAVVDMNV